MPSASAAPTFRSDAHRRAVMQHIGATIVPSALSFAVLAPLAGLALIWGSTFVAMVCNAITTAGETAPALVSTTASAIGATYVASAMAAGIAGVWVALLSPFAPDNARYYSGAAIIGMMNGFLFVSADTQAAGIFGGQLFLALAGAVSVFLCAWLLKDAVLKRDEARRDALARERAERLARERAKLAKAV
ncbi:MAG: hypothetical protein R3C46_10370 [Hyphomonadaceae bacterium]